MAKARSTTRIPHTLKEMVLYALDDLGGVRYLVEQAQTNPGPFMALLGKILPTQVTGPGDGPVRLVVTWGGSSTSTGDAA